MTCRPTSIPEVQEGVRTHRGLRLRGGGTKPGLSAAVADQPVLDLSGLSGLVAHTPEECTFTALAGTRIDVIADVLAAHGQYLPFDPPLAARGATIGGTVASGVNGSCRYRYGGIRDFLIGARLVDGHGEVLTSGGHVVKNAAGFLLHQALVGASGRHAALVELTFKVFPRPEARATVRAEYGNRADALAFCVAIQRRGVDLEAVDLAPPATVWVRLAGFEDGMAERVSALRAAIDTSHAVLTGDDDEAVWREVSGMSWARAGEALVRVPVTPGRIAELDDWLAAQDAARRYTVGGHLAWVSWPGSLALLGDALGAHGLAGQVLVGPPGPRLIGQAPENEVDRRLTQVLDPLGAFA